MRRFMLFSGDRYVAEGVVFSDGAVAVRRFFPRYTYTFKDRTVEEFARENNERHLWIDDAINKDTGMRALKASQGIRLQADDRDERYGNSSHHYTIELEGQETGHHIKFQHGPVKEVGINGITNEVLLAIVIDRLQGFQSSKFACRENALALTKLEEAVHWLEHRTKAREDRGVEGTNQV